MANHYLERSIPELTIEEKIQILRDEDDDLASEQANCDFEYKRINDILDKIDELKQFSYNVDGAYVQTGYSGGQVEEEFVKSLLYSQRYAKNKMKRIANRREDLKKEIKELINKKEENNNESTADNK